MPNKVKSGGSGPETVFEANQRFENTVQLRPPRFTRWGGFISQKGFRPALARIEAAAMADYASANYGGIDVILKGYANIGFSQNQSNWCPITSDNLRTWTSLAHTAQTARGRARFTLPDGCMFRLSPLPGDQIIRCTPVQKWDRPCLMETRFEVTAPLKPLYGTTLGYPVAVSSARELALLRLRVAGIGTGDGSHFELGIHSPVFKARKDAEILRNVPEEAIAQGCGELALWIATEPHITEA